MESAVYARQSSMMMQGGGGPPQMSSVQSSVVLQENIAPPQPNWVPKAYLDKVMIFSSKGYRDKTMMERKNLMYLILS